MFPCPKLAYSAADSSGEPCEKWMLQPCAWLSLSRAMVLSIAQFSLSFTKIQIF